MNIKVDNHVIGKDFNQPIPGIIEIGKYYVIVGIPVLNKISHEELEKLNAEVLTGIISASGGGFMYSIFVFPTDNYETWNKTELFKIIINICGNLEIVERVV